MHAIKYALVFRLRKKIFKAKNFPNLYFYALLY